MKVAIIGYGFVGKAIDNGFNDDVEIFKVDPKLNTSLGDLEKFLPEVIFVCLPTPMNKDGSQDLSIVTETIKILKSMKLSSLIVIKSTIHPGNLNQLIKTTPKFVYNPEFLREKHANDDFIKSKLIIFGGSNEMTSQLADLYSKHTKCTTKDYIFTDFITASLMKYTINTFLATKVIFFNEIFQLFNATNTEEKWENFVHFLSKDQRLGNSHMMVPGHDGRLGFGGACFPKDSSAILEYANSLGVPLETIRNTIKINNSIRAKYNSPTDREEDQNIQYNDFDKE